MERARSEEQLRWARERFEQDEKAIEENQRKVCEIRTLFLIAFDPVVMGILSRDERGVVAVVGSVVALSLSGHFTCSSRLPCVEVSGEQRRSKLVL